MPQADDGTSNEVAETSTNEDSFVSDEDLETSFDDESGWGEDTDDEDEQASESESESVEDAEQEESEEPEEQSEDEAEEASQDEETEEEVTPSKEEQKKLNDLYAQKRIAEKQLKDRALAESQAEYLNNAKDDTQLALRQLQIDAYNNRVEFNNNKLETGINRALAEIDLFRSGPPEVKEALLSALDDFEKLNVKYNENNDPVIVEGDVYQYLKDKADSIRRLTDVGARQSKKDRNKATTRTITTPSKTPKEPKADPEMDAFDEEASRW